ncbi:MAG: right-handed parallel beta-helix repeat-containing protein [Clostridia bacterium]|nr:right-handed parallel beta-helix repeat-containing protein [Clostridia bacterium]
MENLEIANAAMGIRFYYDDSYENSNVTVENCLFKNIYGISWDSLSEKFDTACSAGIFVTGYVGKNFVWGKSFVKNFNIINCESTSSDSLFTNSRTIDDEVLSGSENVQARHNLALVRDLHIEGCKMYRNRVYGIIINGVNGGYMKNCYISNNGTAPFSYGSAGVMLSALWDFTIDECTVEFQNRQGYDPDGCGIDFEDNCHGVTISNCNLRYNDGVGIMLYDNGQGRYNTNINIINNAFEKNNQNVLKKGVPKYSEIFVCEDCLQVEGVISGNTYVKQFYNFIFPITLINDFDLSKLDLVISNNTMLN